MNKYNINLFSKPKIYTFDDISRQMTYNPNNKIKNYSNGQLKLLFCELQFFSIIDIKNLCLNNEIIHVIYIGSGKGYHIPVLISLLSLDNIKWHLFDPFGHCKRLEQTRKNVNIYNRKFSDKDIIQFKDIKKLIFISDIRSSIGSEPSVEELLNDYAIQNDFLIKLQPRYALIKFRYPFPSEIKRVNINNYNYPDGIMYLQCYNKGDSAELRIFIDNTTEISFRKFSLEDAVMYEEKMFWYNNIYRINNENDILISGYILNMLLKLDIYKKIDKQETIIKNLILQIEEIKKYDKEFKYLK